MSNIVKIPHPYCTCGMHIGRFHRMFEEEYYKSKANSAGEKKNQAIKLIESKIGRLKMCCRVSFLTPPVRTLVDTWAITEIKTNTDGTTTTTNKYRAITASLENIPKVKGLKFDA